MLICKPEIVSDAISMQHSVQIATGHVKLCMVPLKIPYVVKHL